MVKSNKFIVGGDFVIQPEIEDGIWGELEDVLSEHHLFLLNVEAPITKCDRKISKTGPAIKMDPSIIRCFDRFENIISTLANNHILDFGEEGVRDTLSILSNNRIKTIGAGVNIENAKQPLIETFNDVKVAFLNTCETEWCAAGDTSAGAYTFDLYSLFHQVSKLKKEVEHVVLIVHGGTEYYNLPSPKRQQIYRLLIDFGFDAIISHHTHCISGTEIYNDKHIIYSLGNLAFPTDNLSKSWNEGMFASFTVSKDDLKLELVPFKYETNILKLLSNDELNDFNKQQKLLNDIILSPSLKDEWEKHCVAQLNTVLNYIFFPRSINFLLRKLGTFIPLATIKFKMLNLLRCESHHDVLLTGLQKVQEKSDN